jgi:hypothetical protein
MTEQGEKWVARVAKEGWWDPCANNSAEWAASLWLRAFCAEVEKRADQLSKANGHVTRGYIETGFCFDDLKRELLGD